MSRKIWAVYLVRCSDESLYCGITNNLENRLLAHNLGKGAKYTRSRRPVELVAAAFEMTKSEALKLEYRIKHVSADKKEVELNKGGPSYDCKPTQAFKLPAGITCCTKTRNCADD